MSRRKGTPVVSRTRTAQRPAAGRLIGRRLAHLGEQQLDDGAAVVSVPGM